MLSETCLMTGGSGLIGARLIEILRGAGYQVRILTRSDAMADRKDYFFWSVDEQIVEPEALRGVNHIIHLAGANIGSQRWTAKRKSKIISSRVDSLNFLFDRVKAMNSGLRSVLSISATGYYGAVTSEIIFNEDDPPGADFLGQTCQAWEQAALRFRDIPVRTVLLRAPMVLSGNGGALPKLMLPVKMGLGAPLGTGRQYMSWVHMDDLCNAFLKALTDSEMNGIYNVCSGHQPSNREFMKEVAQAVQRPCCLPAIPGVILKLVYGEMAVILLEGSRISNKKLLQAGFRFKYADLPAALKQIYS